MKYLFIWQVIIWAGAAKVGKLNSIKNGKPYLRIYLKISMTLKSEKTRDIRKIMKFTQKKSEKRGKKQEKHKQQENGK